MKRFLRKAAAVLLSAVLLAGVQAPAALAATSKVIIHVQDGPNWGTMNVYNWGDKGETAGVWPGAEMTAEGAGWFTYAIETEVPLNLVFSAKGGTPQSGNVDGVPADSGEIWVVVGGEGEANDLGASTNDATLYTEAQEGWPVAEAATEATTDTAAKDLPKTGQNVFPAIAFLSLAALSGTAVVLMKKKESIGRN
jgi:LPXTG-motif cell wall-anchored protein